MGRYDSYKESSIHWVGKIPEDWDESRVKQYFIERNEKVSDIDYPPLSVTKNGILPQLDNVAKSDNHNDRKRVCHNDFVINSRSDRKGSSGLSKLEGSVSLINIVLEPKNFFPKFSEYLFKSKDFVEEFFRNGKGIHWDLWSTRYSELQNIKIPIPPLPEQQQIVSFLDNKTSLIDSLIEKTQRKIELLKEKRNSLINEVVTKGLNPNVEMKDSGVEWIGEIPSHWDRLPLKHFGQVTLGKMLTSEDKGGYHLRPYLRSKNIQVERVDTSEVKEMWFSNNELEKLRLEKGDLLFNEGGDVGRTCIWLNEIDECYIQNSVNRVRFENDDERYYLHLSILYHSVGYYDSLVNRVSIPHLTKEKLESVIFLRPPLSEQQQIVEYLDEKTQKIDKTISIEEKRIELLKEYRQSLISEVVTGKLKVVE
jgi:type I restriction enzyme, S subunit